MKQIYYYDWLPRMMVRDDVGDMERACLEV